MRKIQNPHHRKNATQVNTWICLITILNACIPPAALPASPTTQPGASPTPPITVTPPGLLSKKNCHPTTDDGVSPSYKPDMPVRTVVGQGFALTGIVLSSADCQPITSARLEFWPEYEGMGHPDEARGTIYTDSNGRYRFESDPPEHIHMKISAPGFITIGQNSYHPNGESQGTFDIVLKPEP